MEHKSNQQKKREARELAKTYKKTTRDEEILAVYRASAKQGMPYDKKEAAGFYSGAIWADENPAHATKVKYIIIGMLSGGIVTLAGVIAGFLIH